MHKTMAGRKRKGFSLVEILIVLVILAVISGGGMMIAGKSSDKAKFVTAQNDLDTIQQAFIQYYNVVGNYDDIVAGNLSGAFGTAVYKGSTKKMDVLQSFLSKSIGKWTDPWGNNYLIKTNYSSGIGVIVVYVDSTGGTAYPAGKIGTLDVGNIRSDTTSNASGDEMPMLRIIYNVTF